MFDVISPFINLLWPIVVAIAGILGLFVYGRRKKAEGHKEGRDEQLARSRDSVKKVEREMKAEVQKPRTTKETRDRLSRGDF